MDSHEPKVDRFARVPDALRQRLIGDVPLEQVIAVAPFDLSEEGHYISGYLALREGSLAASSRATATGKATGFPSRKSPKPSCSKAWAWARFG